MYPKIVRPCPYPIKDQLRLDRAAVRVDVAAVRAGSGAVFKIRATVLVLNNLTTVRGADLVVGHRVVVVDARAIGHLPVPTVRIALGHKVDLLAGSAGQRDRAWDEPRTLAHVLRIGAGERSSGIAVVSLPVV